MNTYDVEYQTVRSQRTRIQLIPILISCVLLISTNAEARSGLSTLYKSTPYKVFGVSRSLCTSYDASCAEFFTHLAQDPSGYDYTVKLIADVESNSILSFETVAQKNDPDGYKLTVAQIQAVNGVFTPIYMMDLGREVFENAVKETGREVKRYIALVNDAMSQHGQANGFTWKKADSVSAILNNIEELRTEPGSDDARKTRMYRLMKDVNKKMTYKHGTSALMVKVFGVNNIDKMARAAAVPRVGTNGGGLLRPFRLLRKKVPKFSGVDAVPFKAKVLTAGTALKDVAGFADITTSATAAGVSLSYGISNGNEYLIAKSSVQLAIVVFDVFSLLGSSFVSSSFGPASFLFTFSTLPIFKFLDTLLLTTNPREQFSDFYNTQQIRTLVSSAVARNDLKEVWLAHNAAFFDEDTRSSVSLARERSEYISVLGTWRQDKNETLSILDQTDAFPFTHHERMEDFNFDYLSTMRRLRFHPNLDPDHDDTWINAARVHHLIMQNPNATNSNGNPGSLFIGGPGCDYIEGTRGDDILDAGDWDRGECWDNWYRGYEDDHADYGSKLSDILKGGAGDDILILGPGNFHRDSPSWTDDKIPNEFRPLGGYTDAPAYIDGGSGSDTVYTADLVLSTHTRTEDWVVDVDLKGFTAAGILVDLRPKYGTEQRYLYSGHGKNQMFRTFDLVREQECLGIASFFSDEYRPEIDLGAFSSHFNRHGNELNCDRYFIFQLRSKEEPSEDDRQYTFYCRDSNVCNVQRSWDSVPGPTDRYDERTIAGAVFNPGLGRQLLAPPQVQGSDEYGVFSYWKTRVDPNDVGVFGSPGTRTGYMMNIENIAGTPQADKLIGNDQDNIISGGGGRDLLFGLGGSDRLDGGDQHSILYGGEGDDHLKINIGIAIPGPGDDTIEIVNNPWKQYAYPSFVQRNLANNYGGAIQIHRSPGDDVYAFSAGQETMLKNIEFEGQVTDLGYDAVRFSMDSYLGEYFTSTARDSSTFGPSYQLVGRGSTITFQQGDFEEIKLAFKEIACAAELPEPHPEDALCADNTNEHLEYSFLFDPSNMEEDGIYHVTKTEFTGDVAYEDRVVSFNPNHNLGDLSDAEVFVPGHDLGDNLIFFPQHSNAAVTTRPHTIEGGQYDDVVITGKSPLVTINSFSGNDLIVAGVSTGSLSVDAGDGNNNIRGSSGNDNLKAGSGSDVIRGYDGNDVLTGGAGLNRLYGGSGNDRYIFNSIGEVSVVVDSAGNNTLEGPFENFQMLQHHIKLTGAGITVYVPKPSYDNQFIVKSIDDSLAAFDLFEKTPSDWENHRQCPALLAGRDARCSTRTLDQDINVLRYAGYDVNITSNIEQWQNNDKQASLASINDGNLSTADTLDYAVHPLEADGKYIDIDLSHEQVAGYGGGLLRIHNRTECCNDRINGSTFSFYQGAQLVHWGDITEATQVIDILAPDALYDRVRITFSGEFQNFREIELLPDFFATANSIEVLREIGDSALLINLSDPAILEFNDVELNQETNVLRRDGYDVNITSNIEQWQNNDKQASLASINDGNLSTTGTLDYAVHPWEADGKYIDIDLSHEQVAGYRGGLLRIHNRTECCNDRISGSTVSFYQDAQLVHTSDITETTQEIDILAPNAIYNRVRITFSGTYQNFREIELLPDVFVSQQVNAGAIEAPENSDSIPAILTQDVELNQETNALRRDGYDVNITSNIEQWQNHDKQASLASINDGNLSTAGTLDYAVHPTQADGKYIDIDLSHEQVAGYRGGLLRIHNRTECCKDRISGSTVSFYQDAQLVHTSDITETTQEIDILAPNAIYNRVRITFSGTYQNFREIELLPDIFVSQRANADTIEAPRELDDSAINISSEDEQDEINATSAVFYEQSAISTVTQIEDRDPILTLPTTLTQDAHYALTFRVKVNSSRAVPLGLKIGGYSGAKFVLEPADSQWQLVTKHVGLFWLERSSNDGNGLVHTPIVIQLYLDTDYSGDISLEIDDLKLTQIKWEEPVYNIPSDFDFGLSNWALTNPSNGDWMDANLDSTWNALTTISNELYSTGIIEASIYKSSRPYYLLLGDSSDNQLEGLTNSDELIYGGPGNDNIFLDAVADWGIGGPGDDTVMLSSTYPATNSRRKALLAGGSGNDTLSGGEADDILISGSGSNTLNGGAGRDFLILQGEQGIANGGEGKDVFRIVGTGDNQLSGGAGRDIFVFHFNEHVDGSQNIITDFDPDQDRLKILVKTAPEGNVHIIRIQDMTKVQQGDDLTLSIWGGKRSIVLEGVNESDLSTGNSIVYDFENFSPLLFPKQVPNQTTYEELINMCHRVQQQNPHWTWNPLCTVPELASPTLFETGNCACEGRIWKARDENNFYQCDALPASCGGQTSTPSSIGYEIYRH